VGGPGGGWGGGGGGGGVIISLTSMHLFIIELVDAWSRGSPKIQREVEGVVALDGLIMPA